MNPKDTDGSFPTFVTKCLKDGRMDTVKSKCSPLPHVGDRMKNLHIKKSQIFSLTLWKYLRFFLILWNTSYLRENIWKLDSKKS